MLQKILEKLAKFLGRAGQVGGSSAVAVISRLNGLLPQDHQRRKWVIVGFFSMPVLGTMVAIAGSVETNQPELPLVTGEVIIEPLQLDVSDAAVFEVMPMVRQETIRRGDNIVSTLSRAGANTDGLQNFLSGDDVGRKLFAQLRAGRVLSVQLDGQGNLVWMRYKLNHEEDHLESILVTRAPDGQFASSLEKVEFESEVVFRAGRIDSSLFAAADQANMPESVAIKMAEIFSSQIDFHRELRQGDEFRVVYEQMSLNGQLTGTGRVLAVEFVNAGDTHKAYYFSSDSGASGYYDGEGKSLRSAFLRSPLKFSRISSGFTKRRFHPIQKRWKAHYGVDYAAGTGTPIMATANGKVSFVGRQNGYGNIVILKHHSGYSTRYAHMSRFAKGIRNGTKVEQGDIIGYVGSTGWATGPHLHYEFRVNEQPRNPLTIKLDRTAEPLTSAQLRQFKIQQVALDHRLALANSLNLARAE